MYVTKTHQEKLSLFTVGPTILIPLGAGHTDDANVGLVVLSVVHCVVVNISLFEPCDLLFLAPQSQRGEQALITAGAPVWDWYLMEQGSIAYRTMLSS